ncbi:MAG: response regulator [Candidatus Saccharimonadota bacterium]
MSLRILLVEDDAWLAETQSAVLVKAGYSVRVAPHAPAAIAMVDRELPDAIVLDVLLAGSTAFALLHELQSYADTGEIPIILCTNLAEQFELKQLKNYGVKRIVDKTTMHPNDIVTALKAILT